MDTILYINLRQPARDSNGEDVGLWRWTSKGTQKWAIERRERSFSSTGPCTHSVDDFMRLRAVLGWQPWSRYQCLPVCNYMLAFASLFVWNSTRMEPQYQHHIWCATEAVACAILPGQRAIVSVFADSNGRIGRIKRRMCMKDTERCDVCNKDSSMLSLLFCAIL